MAGEQRIDSEHLFAVRLMQHLVVPTFVLDDQGKVIIWNKACERLTGVKADELIGTRDHWMAFYEVSRECLADFLVSGNIKQLDTLYSSYTDPKDEHQGLSAENWCTMPRVDKRLYLAIDAGPIYDDHGKLIAVVETLRDMTSQKLAQNALKSMAHKDGLTGLANRRAFDDKLELEWNQGLMDKSPVTLLLIDVDHFKRYNDSYGHQQGDECLKIVAQCLKQQVHRSADLAARYGGEEFALILPNVNLKDAVSIAERTRCAILELNIEHKTATVTDRLTISIGVASLIPDSDSSSKELILQADKHLYQAKGSGRNRVCFEGKENYSRQ